QLGYRGQEGPAAAEWFLSWLQSTERGWLVVLDDLADPANLVGLWPQGPRGRTLVTTRRTDAVLSSQGRRRIDVGLFTSTEARSYLVAKLGAEPGSARVRQVDELAADLGYLPLALAQAAAFILNYDDTCAGHRTRLADRRSSLAKLFPPDALADDYRATVAATWSMSIEAADQLVPRGVCRPLLQIASVLDPNGFPAEMIQTDAVLSYVSAHRTTVESGASPQNATVSEQDCRDGLRNLARLSLISLDPGGGSTRLRVHALVQRATLERVEQNHLTSLLRAAAAGLVQAWPEIERDPQLGQVLRANTTALAERHPDALWEPDAHPVLFRAGRSLGECGLVSAAVEHWTQMGRHAVHILGADHSDTLGTRSHLAYWRGEAGDAVGAATAFEELLTDYLRVLGADHPHTLITRSHLARWRGEADQK
ncbi:MAG: tetratricopeptide repeat protein, partial [Sciscionella sp.]